VLGVPAGLLIVGNWLTVIGALWEAIRLGRSRNFSFCPPFLCGVFGAIACLVCPVPEVRSLAWLPLVADPSILVLIVAVMLHGVARLIGKHSPFDPEPKL
jgi:hypothetical protein